MKDCSPTTHTHTHTHIYIYIHTFLFKIVHAILPIHQYSWYISQLSLTIKKTVHKVKDILFLGVTQILYNIHICMHIYIYIYIKCIL